MPIYRLYRPHGDHTTLVASCHAEDEDAARQHFEDARGFPLPKSWTIESSEVTPARPFVAIREALDLPVDAPWLGVLAKVNQIKATSAGAFRDLNARGQEVEKFRQAVLKMEGELAQARSERDRLAQERDQWLRKCADMETTLGDVQAVVRTMQIMQRAGTNRIADAMDHVLGQTA